MNLHRALPQAVDGARRQKPRLLARLGNLALVPFKLLDNAL